MLVKMLENDQVVANDNFHPSKSKWKRIFRDFCSKRHLTQIWKMGVSRAFAFGFGAPYHHSGNYL